MTSDEPSVADDLAASEAEHAAVPSDGDATAGSPASTSDGEGRVGGAVQEGFVSLRILWAFARAPWVLVYPPLVLLGFLVGFVVPPAIVLLIAALVDQAILAVLVLPAAYVGPSLFGGHVWLAYCHDVNEVISGRRPWPLEGLVAAIPKLPTYLYLVGLSLVGSSIAQTASVSDSAAGRAAGSATHQAMQMTYAVAMPVIAITDGSLRDTLADVQETFSEQWGAVLVSTVGFRSVSMLLFHLTFWPALAIGAFNLGLLFTLDTEYIAFVPYGPELVTLATDYLLLFGPLGPFTLPAALFALSVLLPIGVMLTFKPIVNTIIVRWALDGELPDGLQADVEELVDDESVAGDGDRGGSSADGTAA